MEAASITSSSNLYSVKKVVVGSKVFRYNLVDIYNDNTYHLNLFDYAGGEDLFEIIRHVTEIHNVQINSTNTIRGK